MKTLKDLERPLHIHNLELLLKEDLVKNNDALFETINFAIEKLRIPTSDDVCRELQSNSIFPIQYREDIKSFGFYDSDEWEYISYFDKDGYGLSTEVTSKQLLFIARFYEGVIE